MLLERQKVEPLAAIERLAGLQAQVAWPPFVGLWTRLRAFARRELVDLLHGRQVVRATAMRGTLHLLSASDYVALRGALQPGLSKGMAATLRDGARELDLADLDAFARDFFGRRPATFDALRDQLKTARPKGNERAQAYAIRTHVPLVQVPTDSAWGFPAAAEFTLAEPWLGREVPTTGVGAEELVVRYLAAFGPASIADAQTWSGLAGLRETFDRMRPRLATFRDERQRELFDLPDAPRPAPDCPAPVRYLPDFDNLVLAHEDRRRVVADEHRGALVTKNLLVRATFLVDGFVAGTWKIERTKKSATLALEPFAKLSKKVVAELEREGQELLAFAEPDAATRAVRVAK